MPDSAAGPSGPANVSAVHAAIPDVASVPDQRTATGERYHCPLSGGRAAATWDATGAVWSSLMTFVRVAVVPALFWAVHMRVVPAVSRVSGTAGSQPEVATAGRP